MNPNKKEISANIVMQYGNTIPTLDELKYLEKGVTRKCWRYLVGKFCGYENKKRRDGEQAYNAYEELGAIFGYKSSSLKKVVAYAGAIDRLYSILPDVASEILSGEVKISAEDTITLSWLKFYEINDIMIRRSNESTLTKIIIEEQKALRKKIERRGRPRRSIDKAPRTSIKDMPVDDPDSRIKMLIYTVPSWVSMVERAFDASDFNSISSTARSKLAMELEKLTASVETLRELLTEVVQ